MKILNKYSSRSKQINKDVQILCPIHSLKDEHKKYNHIKTVNLFDKENRLIAVGCLECFKRLKINRLYN